MIDLIRDVRIAFRGLIARPGFALVAVMTLAVGIGANTAIYSLVQAVMLRPLPFPAPDRLVQVRETAKREELEFRSLSFPMLRELAASGEVFEDVAGIDSSTVNLGGGDEPELISAEAVTPSYFPMLGVKMALGRAFAEEEGLEPVAVIARSLWERRFGSDPDVIGRIVLINEIPATIVGVATDQGIMGDAELWFPLEVAPRLDPRIRVERFESRGTRWLSAIGRLKANVSHEALDEWMARETRRLRSDFPEVMENRGVLALPLEKELFGDVQQTATLLMSAVGLVMLIACANLASLLLAHGVQREREVALRFALGATRSQVSRQFLVESMLLASFGGAAGLVLALWSKDLLRGVSLFDRLPAYVQLDFDVETLLFTGALSIATALLFGAAPAIAASRSGPGGSLRSRSDARKTRLAPGRSLLVTMQVALAVVLTVASGLMVRSLVAQLRIEPGFRTESVYTLRVQLPGQRYDGEGSIGFSRALEERLRALPGVSSIALTSDVPLVDGYSARQLLVEDWLRQGSEGSEDSVRVYHHAVSPGFFPTMGIRLKGGRDFTWFDGADAPLAVIVNEKLATRAWPGEDALGKRIGLNGPDGPWRTVVGVVGQVRHRDLVLDPVGNPDDPDIYLPLAQAPTGNLGIVLNVAPIPGGTVDLERVRREIRALDAAIPVYEMRSMSEVLDAELALPRLASWLLGLFGGLAIVLAALGLYGLLAHLVAQRAREIGIQMALGAEAGRIVRSIASRGLALAGAGIAIGLVASLGLGRFLESRLFEISATDPVTLVACVVLLALVALLASYVPARRATRIDPMIALRQE